MRPCRLAQHRSVVLCCGNGRLSSQRNVPPGLQPKPLGKAKRRQRELVEPSAEKSAGPLDSQDEGAIDEIVKKLPIDETAAKEWLRESADQLPVRGWTLSLYIGGAFLFGLGVWALQGQLKAEEYFAGYLLEQSLSVDNLFVFILVFDYFETPLQSQGKVLTYGLLTAAVLRLVLINIGAELVESFQPVLLVFASVLLFSSWGLLTKREDEEAESLSDNSVVKLCRKFLDVTPEYAGDNFFSMVDGVRQATPLLLVLAVIELSDVLFAVDSIPAVFGVTTDPFIIWTSNMWALLSLRSLFSFVAVAISKLRFLDKAVALVLAWVGVKLCAEYFAYDIDTSVSLSIIAAILGSGVAASFVFPSKSK